MNRVVSVDKETETVVVIRAVSFAQLARALGPRGFAVSVPDAPPNTSLLAIT